MKSASPTSCSGSAAYSEFYFTDVLWPDFTKRGAASRPLQPTSTGPAGMEGCMILAKRVLVGVIFAP